MSTRSAFLLGLVAACARAKPPAPVSPAPAAARAAETGPRCRSLGGYDLEVCTHPAPADLDGQLVITLRRGADGAVLWTEVADALAQAHMVGDQKKAPMFQVVIVHHVDPTDDDEVEDAYYVIDLELVDGKVNEVNRFRDSGD